MRKRLWLEAEVKINSHWVEVRIASVTLCIAFDMTTPNSNNEYLQIKMVLSMYFLTSYFFFTLNYAKTIERILKTHFQRVYRIPQIFCKNES